MSAWAFLLGAGVVFAGSAGDDARLRAACKKRDAAACTELGYRVALDRGRDNVGMAAELWRWACEGVGHQPACVPYAQVLLSGFEPSALQVYRDGARAPRPVPVDRSRGRRLLRSACDRGQAKGCTQLALAVDENEKGRAESCPLLSRACTLGDEWGCRTRLAWCPRRLRARPGDPSRTIAAQSLSAAGGRAVLVEQGDTLRQPQSVASLFPDGRWEPVARVARGFWAVAACGDGRSVWLGQARTLVRATPGSVQSLALPSSPRAARSPAGQGEQPLDALSCLEDGSAVAIRVLEGPITDDEVRAALARDPELLTTPESARLQELKLSIYPHTRPRELEQGRALARAAAADLREGAAWEDVVKKAEEHWYRPFSVDREFEHVKPLPGYPPDEVFALDPGAVLGPIEELTSVRRGSHDRSKGALTLWRMVSYTPASTPPPAEAVELARARLTPRVLEVLVVSANGAMRRQRFSTLRASVEAPRGLDPVIPLGGSRFLLLGDDRRLHDAGRWSSDDPVLRALGPGRIRAAARDGDRLLVATEDALLVVGLNGERILSVPLRDEEEREIRPIAVGRCGQSRICVAAFNLSQLDVLLFDERLQLVGQDRLAHMDSVGSGGFTGGAFWVLSRYGARVGDGPSVLVYRDRQLTEIALRTKPR